MSRPDVTNSLTLTDYFDELNPAGKLQFSDIDFDSKYYDIINVGDTTPSPPPPQKKNNKKNKRY